MGYAFKPHGNQFGIPTYTESETLAQIKHEIRGHSPCSTKFKARAIGPGKWAILSFSPYTIGPNLVGYLSDTYRTI
jgi:hypothetical protein